MKEDTVVNRRTVDREGGDARVTLKNEIPSPQGLTVTMVHPTVDPSSIRFFEELHVVDADDPNRTFSFSLKGAECLDASFMNRFSQNLSTALVLILEKERMAVLCFRGRTCSLFINYRMDRNGQSMEIYTTEKIW